MKSFDYKTAWNTLAKPAFDSIPACVKAEVELIAADNNMIQVDHVPHYDVAGTNGKMFTVGMPTKNWM